MKTFIKATLEYVDFRGNHNDVKIAGTRMTEYEQGVTDCHAEYQRMNDELAKEFTQLTESLGKTPADFCVGFTREFVYQVVLSHEGV